MTALSALHAELLSIGSRYSGKWTYALTDLTTGERIGRDEDDVMPAASLIKAPILVALYQAVHDGRLALDDRTTCREEHRTLGSGVLQRLSPGVEMSVRDAAVLMIIISDNVATNMCVDLVGIDAINAQMRRYGLEKTTLFCRWGDPSVDWSDGRNHNVSTAGEMARLLELIARHEAVSEEASEDMLRIMRRLDGRGELTRLLPWSEMNTLPDPKTNWVAEKGGSFVSARCSGAIFHGTRGHFVMSAFCEGGTGPGTGRSSEGNVILGELGFAAWRALAADASIVPNRT
jgi:beta-lactamase class A